MNCRLSFDFKLSFDFCLPALLLCLHNNHNSDDGDYDDLLHRKKYLLSD